MVKICADVMYLQDGGLQLKTFHGGYKFVYVLLRLDIFAWSAAFMLEYLQSVVTSAAIKNINLLSKERWRKFGH